MKRYACQTLPPLLLAELSHIKRWRKKAIKGKDPEGVHQLRVSLRRMRSALKVFSPVIEPAYQRRWRSRLKRLAKALDEARDLDVLLETHYSQSTGKSELERHLRKHKKQCQKKLARQLQSKTFTEPCRKLKKQLKKQNWPQKYGRKQSYLTTALAVTALEQRYQEVLAQQSGLNLNDEAALHQLRINIKQLRYGCELLAPVLKRKKNATFMAAMKDLQDDLGLIHDACVQQTMLTEIPLPAKQEFSQIAQDAKSRSQLLKSTLAVRLQSFIDLPVPWATLKTDPGSG